MATQSCFLYLPQNKVGKIYLFFTEATISPNASKNGYTMEWLENPIAFKSLGSSKGCRLQWGPVCGPILNKFDPEEVTYGQCTYIQSPFETDSYPSNCSAEYLSVSLATIQ